MTRHDPPDRRPHWLRLLALRLALMAGSLLFVVLFFELFVFRFVLVASDFPRNRYVDGVIKWQPHQSGVRRVRNEIKARYTINAQGWNSAHSDYRFARTPGLNRIAVIGDSFVEALIVDRDSSLAEDLERSLGPDHWEVYRFGITGAPLTEYLQILRCEAIQYDPDLVVIVLIHNDFIDSYKLRLGKYSTSFLRVAFSDSGVTEIQPQPYRSPWFLPLRGTATYRFLVDRMQANIYALRERAMAMAGHQRFEANIDVFQLAAERPKIEVVVEYVFGRLDRLRKENGFHLLLVMDGDRESIYRDSGHSEALELNGLCARAAERHGLDFLDLEPIFECAFRRDRQKLNFNADWHWNTHGHQVVAEAIADHLRAHPDLMTSAVAP